MSIVVEADGAEFHDKDKDTKRDNEIRETFKLDTLRFSGSRIYHDPEGCIVDIINKFDKLSKEKLLALLKKTKLFTAYNKVVLTKKITETVDNVQDLKKNLSEEGFKFKPLNELKKFI